MCGIDERKPLNLRPRVLAQSCLQELGLCKTRLLSWALDTYKSGLDSALNARPRKGPGRGKEATGKCLAGDRREKERGKKKKRNTGEQFAE
jgi:hypothetical protein